MTANWTKLTTLSNAGSISNKTKEIKQQALCGSWSTLGTIQPADELGARFYMNEPDVLSIYNFEGWCWLKIPNDFVSLISASISVFFTNTQYYEYYASVKANAAGTSIVTGSRYTSYFYESVTMNRLYVKDITTSVTDAGVAAGKILNVYVGFRQFGTIPWSAYGTFRELKLIYKS